MKYQTIDNRFDPIPVYKSNESQTVPDMSYTPREIIAKFSRGERVPLGFQGQYDPDDMSPFADDPTRDPSFDFGDYVEEKYALEERQKAQAAAAQRSAGSISKRKASYEELSASDATKSATTSGEKEPAPKIQDKA